jgi:mono/diheme cytochrome c family protein
MKWNPSPVMLLVLAPVVGASLPQEVKTAQEIFLANCAACHGPKGDGNGTAELERRARSFVEGGFSFGNTSTAIRRTITSGIPGTPMPSSEGALSEDQIRRLADYVISLGPGLSAPPANTELVVGERPAVVRGLLPPISSGATSHARGLLIGLPDGFSFEYRTDDLRLLGMRGGRFVNRSDWIGRGGTPLEPLGPVILLEQGGAPQATFFMRKQGRRVALRSRMRGTRISGQEVWVQSELLDAEGRVLAAVDERISAQLAPFGNGYLRQWKIQAKQAALMLELAPIPNAKKGDAILGLSPWLASKPGQALAANAIAVQGEDLWLVPAQGMALQPGERGVLNLCRLRLTLEAKTAAGEAR